jgi:SAM-dependent methyltransferase
VEPSFWLYEKARVRGLPIICGTVEDIPYQMYFDLVTCIDVIEHIDNPVGMLKRCSSLLDKDGKLLIITPDSESVAARLLGYKWWHYRIAHISYFNLKTLKFAIDISGLKVIQTWKPGWHFTLEYLCERLKNYLPEAILPRWKWLSKISIPLNLFDSIAVICSKS